MSSIIWRTFKETYWWLGPLWKAYKKAFDEEGLIFAFTMLLVTVGMVGGLVALLLLAIGYFK
jgi:hypothetical protein